MATIIHVGGCSDINYGELLANNAKNNIKVGSSSFPATIGKYYFVAIPNNHDQSSSMIASGGTIIVSRNSNSGEYYVNACIVKATANTVGIVEGKNYIMIPIDDFLEQ